MNDNADNDPRLYAIPDIHGHAKGEHKAFTDERPIPLSARMLFLWFYHACRRGRPRFLMVTDHMNYLTFEDPAAINLVRRALKLAQAGDLYGAAETASVEVGQAQVVCDGLRRGMRYSIGAEVDNDPRSRPDAQNIVDAMKPDGMIRSVHFLTIDHPVHGPGWNWPFDNPEFSDVYSLIGTAKTWQLYMATLLDAVERLPGHIVGHFYVPAIFGHWPDDAVLDAYENQIVDACEARGMALELNTRFLYRHHSEEEQQKYLTVHRRLLAKCKARNVGIAIGSDAHSPKDQGRAFDRVLALLDECAINELVFPIAGRLARVALRVERKDEARPPLRDSATPTGIDDRKTLRKARASEAPVRPKDSAFKRDDSVADADAGARDEPLSAKAKPRPKRSKNRAAPTGGEEANAVADAENAAEAREGDAPDAVAQAGQAVIAPAGNEIAVSIDSAVILLAAAEPVVEKHVRADSKPADRVGSEPPDTGSVVSNSVTDQHSDELAGGEPMNAEIVVDEPTQPLVDEPVSASILDEPVGYASILKEPTGATLIDPQADAAAFDAEPTEAAVSDAPLTNAAAFIAEPADFGSEEEPTGSGSLDIVALLEELIDTESIVAIDRVTSAEAPIDAQSIDILRLVEDLIDAESIVDVPTNATSPVAEQADAESLGADLAEAESLIQKLIAGEQVAEPPAAQSHRAELIAAESLAEILSAAALLAEPSGGEPIASKLPDAMQSGSASENDAESATPFPDETPATEPVRSRKDSRIEPFGGRPVKAASSQSKSGSATAKKKGAGAKAKPAVKKPPKPSTKVLTKKTTAKKSAVKTSAVKSAAGKKSRAKKPTAKKAVRGTAKKVGAKKTAAKKISAKKPAQKRR